MCLEPRDLLMDLLEPELATQKRIKWTESAYRPHRFIYRFLWSYLMSSGLAGAGLAAADLVAAGLAAA